MNTNAYKTPTPAGLRRMFGKIYPYQPARQPRHRTPRAANNTRMRRALSWLERYAVYEKIENSRGMAGKLIEERFLCLWIALNAAYGNNDFVVNDKRTSEPKQFRKLLCNILDFCENDADSMRRLVCAINMCKEEVIELAGTPFLYSQFWGAEQGLDPENPEKYNAWVKASIPEKEHRKKQRKIQKRIDALSPTNGEYVRYVLNQTFERLNMLRNQVMHGSAEYEEKYNRSSLTPGIAVLRACLPEILHVMLTAMQKKRDDDRWGAIAYPPYLNKPDKSENPPKNN